MKFSLKKILLVSALALPSYLSFAADFSWPETVNDTQVIEDAMDTIPNQLQIPAAGSFFEVKLAAEIWEKSWPVINNFNRNSNVNQEVAFELLKTVSRSANLEGNWVCVSGYGPVKLIGDFNYQVAGQITITNLSFHTSVSPNMVDVTEVGQTVTCGWRSSNH